MGHPGAMQFWSGTAFMNTSDALAVTRMLDETGFDGMICADHLIYPRHLTSPYPSGAPPRRGRRRPGGRTLG